MYFNGVVDKVKTVSSGLELVEEFYQPANTDAGVEDFYTADSFLRYGSALKVVRMATTGLFSANDSGNTFTIKNSDEYEKTIKTEV